MDYCYDLCAPGPTLKCSKPRGVRKTRVPTAGRVSSGPSERQELRGGAHFQPTVQAGSTEAAASELGLHRTGQRRWGQEETQRGGVVRSRAAPRVGAEHAWHVVCEAPQNQAAGPAAALL